MPLPVQCSFTAMNKAGTYALMHNGWTHLVVSLSIGFKMQHVFVFSFMCGVLLLLLPSLTFHKESGNEPNIRSGTSLEKSKTKGFLVAPLNENPNGGAVCATCRTEKVRRNTSTPGCRERRWSRRRRVLAEEDLSVHGGLGNMLRV